uniref:ATP-dependent RNA helicase DHX34 n=1 Tax=Steinernema glaseri TaxID=37863 RepID=A0A1I7YHG7_9BILA
MEVVAVEGSVIVEAPAAHLLHLCHCAMAFLRVSSPFTMELEDEVWRARKVLYSAYFGKGRYTPRGSTDAQFFHFLEKLLALSRKKKEKHGKLLDMSVRRKLIRFDFQWLREARNAGDIRHLREDIVEEFEFAVGSYAAYRNRDRFNKVKKLRESQKSLPIAVERQNILDLLEMNQVVIVAGDTGCGKSTQLPRYLLEAGYGKIACTQPRRIACTALAKRVAFETLNQYGNKVAYQIRFEKTKTRMTRILFLTEGLLLRQLATDRSLNQYNVIILDEVHERNLHGDLLVALLRDVIPKRPDLKLILMSATINLDLFTGYFEGAPVVQVPGRLFPIELKYMPVKEHDTSKTAKIDIGPYLRILQMIDQKYPSKDRGDVLIFVNGMAAISTIAEGLKKYAEHSKRWIILRLHSSLTEEEQDKVFDMAPAGVRKCIISTNIAETSLTIDEIRFVIDSGKVNLARYDPITRSSRLTDCWVSKASANQRMGRAGRTGPGVCFRLYSSDHFNKMENFTPSEIRRVSLDSLILQILGMKLNWDVEDFPFLERPDEEAFKEAITSLQCQGVLLEENHNVLTPLGEILSMLPVDVAIGKMLVYSCVMNQIEVVLTVAAGLSVQYPFTAQSFQSSNLVKKREEMMSSIGDPFVLVNVYREWLEAKARGENTREWSRDRGIDESRLYEISKLRKQFAEILEQANLIEKEEEDSTKFERRVRAGDKRRLRELKKEARFQEKKRKVLKYEKHFDSFMDIDEEGDQNDPLKEISFLEFAVAHNQREVNKVIRCHKLRDLARPVVKMIIASGLYPQVAMEHTHNVHTYGHAQLAYCRSKPFVKIHPNGCLSQHPDFLDIEQDHDGVSDNHHLLYYGMLLETTDPFLVNTAKIPAVLLIAFARSVIHVEPRIICCDGFIEFIFDREEHAEDVFKQACEIRREFAEAMARKLANQKYGGRELDRKIGKLSRSAYPLRLRRIMYPPVGMLLGVHSLKDGAISFAVTVDKDDSATDATSQDSQDGKKEEDEPEEKKGKLQRFCNFCQKMMYFVGPTDAARHMRSHKEEQKKEPKEEP